MNSLDRVLIANERWNSHMQENGPEDSHHGGISQESFLDVNRVLQRWHEANKLYESYSAGTSIDDDPTPTTTTDEICTEEEFREAVKLTKIYVDRYLHQKSDFPNVEGLFRRIEATTDLISTRCGVYVVRTKRV
ncbi:MAG: hypothetical protein M1834_003790 [Cirrosporium novae-zelandiae]|nr:MAG: hypothetical protein M1834_003790 [Cirrosporium novae-zelandiae]